MAVARTAAWNSPSDRLGASCRPTSQAVPPPLCIVSGIHEPPQRVFKLPPRHQPADHVMRLVIAKIPDLHARETGKVFRICAVDAALISAIELNAFRIGARR